jgi:hypothetical protein
MSSIRRRLTVPEVSGLLDQTTVNNLVTSARVNSLVTSARVNSLVTSERVDELLTNKIKVGTIYINDNSSLPIDMGSTVAGAVVAFNDLGNIHTACGVTWSGSVITIRNSSGANQSISYMALVE